MIHFEKVGVTRHRTRILGNVSFDIRPGEKAGLTGPSGSGKSTLLNALMGIFPVNEGRIIFADKVVSSDSIREIRRSVAYIAQEPMLGAETVRDSILLPYGFRVNRAQKPGETRIREMLTQVGLAGDMLDRRVINISGGEKQRVAIARALLLGKKVFLCDEITSALDAESRDIVLGIFQNPAFTMLSVSHDEKWLSACDRRLTVAGGTVTEES
ncbi:MAG: ATP-binding cassette domain-containing protein [Thermodesulfobacteriota bacterium]|nr:ATP-binding cassette domain-containing protein [Thermodesulfobacteriota bacterium]